jgi:hypothetical protein
MKYETWNAGNGSYSSEDRLSVCVEPAGKGVVGYVCRVSASARSSKAIRRKELSIMRTRLRLLSFENSKRRRTGVLKSVAEWIFKVLLFCLDPALDFQADQGRVNGALIKLQEIACHLLNAAGDTVWKPSGGRMEWSEGTVGPEWFG